MNIPFTKAASLSVLVFGVFAQGRLAVAAQTGPKNATVLIIRHGEKDDPTPKGDIGLNSIGQKRAQKYIGYFTTQTVKGHPIKPDVLFATKLGNNSDRSRLTIQPLADALKEKINQKFADDDAGGLVSELRSGPYDGETVLICWHHEKIDKIIDRLGADSKTLLGAKKWPDPVFGWLVILHFDRKGGLASSRVVNEKLMSDDTMAPPR